MPTCQICLGKIRKNVLYTCACNEHKYHKSCVDVWFLNFTNTCPICKHEEPNVIKRNMVNVVFTYDVGYKKTMENIHEEFQQKINEHFLDNVMNVTFKFEKFGQHIVDFTAHDANIEFKDLRYKKTAQKIVDFISELKKQ